MCTIDMSAYPSSCHAIFVLTLIQMQEYEVGVMDASYLIYQMYYTMSIHMGECIPLSVIAASYISCTSFIPPY